MCPNLVSSEAPSCPIDNAAAALFWHRVVRSVVVVIVACAVIAARRCGAIARGGSGDSNVRSDSRASLWGYS